MGCPNWPRGLVGSYWRDGRATMTGMTSTKPPSQEDVLAVDARVAATGQVTDADLYVLAASVMSLIEAILPIRAMAADPPAYQLARTVLWTVPRPMTSTTS